MWMVDIAVELTEGTMDAWDRINTEVLAAVGPKHEGVDSGTGFGHRDMQFFFSKRKDADAAAERVKANVKNLVLCDVEFHGND